MRWSRLISRLLLLIVSLTVLSPHFAWEVMAADAHHATHGASLVLSEPHEHEDGHPRLDHHDGHACGGHMFSHMPAQVSASLPPQLVPLRDTYDAAAATAYPSRHPDSVERPPRPRLA